MPAPELATGRYRLVIGVDQPPEQPPIERRLSVWVHDCADVLFWTDLSELVAETVAAARPALARLRAAPEVAERIRAENP